MDTEESATQNDAQTIEGRPIKRRASEARVGVPESADVDTIVEQLKSDRERLPKWSHDAVMIVAKQNHCKIATRLGVTLSTMRQESNVRFTSVERKIEGGTNVIKVIQKRIDASESTHVISIIAHHPQEVVKEMSKIQFLSLSRKKRRDNSHKETMEESLEDTYRPTNSITHVFCNSKQKGSKRISPTVQQTHHRTKNHPVLIRFQPRGKVLTETAETCEILPQHNLRNVVEQDPHTKPYGTLKFQKHDRKSLKNRINWQQILYVP